MRNLVRKVVESLLLWYDLSREASGDWKQVAKWEDAESQRENGMHTLNPKVTLSRIIKLNFATLYSSILGNNFFL